MNNASRFWRVTLFGCATLCIAACGDSPTDSQAGPATLRAVSGASGTDTIDAPLAEPLLVEVRGTNGAPARGIVIQIEPQPTADAARRNEVAVLVCVQPCKPSTTLVSTITDAGGRAHALVRLGHVPGRAVVRFMVPEFGLVDSAVFTVTAGAAAGVRALAPDTVLEIGATAALRGRVVDRYNNTRAELPLFTVAPSAIVTANAASGVVTARDIGSVWVVSRLGVFADSTNVSVVPAGRLVVWSATQDVRLINVAGTLPRIVLARVASDLGTNPRFNATRERVTFNTRYAVEGANSVIVADTTGAIRQNIGPVDGFNSVFAARELADGTVLVVARRITDPRVPYASVYRIAADNTITLVTGLRGLASDGLPFADISPDGTRVAYTTNAFVASSTVNELRVLNLTNGVNTLLETAARLPRSPRWSFQGDRVLYTVTSSDASRTPGVPVIINADGTGRRELGNLFMSPGFSWSPDGAYVIGRSTSSVAFRLIRVSDGTSVLLRYRNATGIAESYFQPDWR